MNRFSHRDTYLRLGSLESAAETESGMQETHEGTTNVKGRAGGLPEGQACPTLGVGRELSCHPRPRMAVTLGEPSHGQRADRTHHN